MPDRPVSFFRKFFGRGNALWGFAEGIPMADETQITRVIWGRVLVLLVVLAVVGWNMLALAAYSFVRHVRSYETVTYTQFVFPWNWDAMRLTQGEEMIARAKVQLQEQRLRDAFFSLRIGVSKSPANLEGRLLLAQFYTVLGRQDQAIDLMLNGLDQANQKEDLQYLRGTFQLLLQFQEDLKAVEVADRLLPAQPEISVRNQLIALAKATALYNRGNYDQAEQIVEEYQLLSTREGWPLMAKIDWERGYRELAVRRLEELTQRFPQEDSIYVLLGAYYREMGMDTRAESAALLRQLINPESPSPRIALMYAYHEKRDTTRLATAIDNYVAEFGTSRDALWALADFAANTGNISLAQRVLEVCTQNNIAKDGPQLMAIEASIVARDFRNGIQLIEELNRTAPRLASSSSAVIDGLLAIAQTGLGNFEEADIALTRFLNQSNLRVESLLAVSNRLMELGAKDRARLALDSAVQADPLNQAALSTLISIDLDLGATQAVGANLTRLLTMRKPSIPLMDRAYTMLGSDFFTFLGNRNTLLEALQKTIADRRAATTPTPRLPPA